MKHTLVYILAAFAVLACGKQGSPRGVVIGGSVIAAMPVPSDVVNSGIGGQTCEEIAARFVRDALTYRPQWVWLQCGHNDLRVGRNTTQIIGSLKGMLEHARSYGVRVIVLTLGYHPRANTAAQIDEVNSWIREHEHIDYAVWANSAPDSMFSDGLHPTLEGYADFLEGIDAY